jgi:hypothetical protein
MKLNPTMTLSNIWEEKTKETEAKEKHREAKEKHAGSKLFVYNNFW